MSQHHILFIGHLWPEPDSSAAGYRTMGLITACLDQHWKVSFACAAEQTLWSVDLEKIGISCYSIKINSDSFDVWISQLLPDFVVFDRFMTEEQFSWRVEKNSPETIAILDTSDLHFLRHSRHKLVKQLSANNDKNLSKDLDLNNEDTIREISAIYRCDLSLIISSFEMNLLEHQFNINKQLLMYLPFMFDAVEPNQLPVYHQREHFFMIGNYLHEPNWDAVLWTKKALWPKIHQLLPNAQLHIYGAYTPDKARQLHKPNEGFYIMGRAENLDTLIKKYRVNLVPLRFGAGIKGKIADGFYTGLPCISTSIGAEGMADGLPWGGYISDNEDSFVEFAISLYNNAEIWQQKSQDGLQIMSQIHNKTIHQQAFIKQLLFLKETILKEKNGLCRNNNFIGSMLKYHLHRSHEFMSRWIEAKNKKL